MWFCLAVSLAINTTTTYLMSSVVQSAVSPTDSAAFARAFPYAKSAASLVLSSSIALSRAIFAALAFTAKIIAHPIVFLSPFPVLLYILAPAIVLVQIILEVIVYSPYRAILYLSDAFYPAYVFLGVACITGALLGFGGRLAVLSAIYLFSPPPPPPPPPVTMISAEEEKRRIL
jgi:hypothetical protein